jgi:hypothetical protein
MCKDVCAAVVQCKATFVQCSSVLNVHRDIVAMNCRIEWQARGPPHATVHVLVTFGTMHPCISFSIVDADYDDNYDDDDDTQ